MQALLWDVFCRVIDNHGDLGVCWRLATDLARRGHQVRLWVDDARALAWMAPQGEPGVEVCHWPDEETALPAAGDVVIEAFGCDPPARFVAQMQRPQPPAWINLEYLSAEDYVERSHGLPSPVMSGPGRGLTKHFFYPGFTDRTGGLLREPGLMAAQASFDASAWLAARGIDRRPGERLVTLFCYDHAPVAALLRGLVHAMEPGRVDDRMHEREQGQAHAPASVRLLTTPGPATTRVEEALKTLPAPAGLQVQALPWLSQADYDRLLWAADLNLVRGEDSFVRAMWAGRPFLWHIYRQDDGAHEAKLDAFLARLLDGVEASQAQAWRTAWAGWNAVAGQSARLSADWSAALPTFLQAAARQVALRWRERLLQQADLVTQLEAFVSRLRPPAAHRGSADGAHSARGAG